MSFTINRFGSIATGIVTLLALIATPSVRAAERTEAVDLVAKSAATLRALAQDPDFASMKAGLAKAHGVLIFPRVLKAGFLLGGAGGSSVLMARDTETGNWVGPAFYSMGTASLGFQAGAASAEMVMLVNTQKALESLTANKLKLGADASVALGAKDLDKSLALDTDFVIYSKVKGAFAGIAIDGSVLDVRRSLNAAYYGQAATPVDILIKRSVSSPDASALQAALMDAQK